MEAVLKAIYKVGDILTINSAYVQERIVKITKVEHYKRFAQYCYREVNKSNQYGHFEDRCPLVLNGRIKRVPLLKAKLYDE